MKCVLNADNVERVDASPRSWAAAGFLGIRRFPDLRGDDSSLSAVSVRRDSG